MTSWALGLFFFFLLSCERKPESKRGCGDIFIETFCSQESKKNEPRGERNSCECVNECKGEGGILPRQHIVFPSAADQARVHWGVNTRTFEVALCQHTADPPRCDPLCPFGCVTSSAPVTLALSAFSAWYQLLCWAFLPSAAWSEVSAL